MWRPVRILLAVHGCFPPPVSSFGDEPVYTARPNPAAAGTGNGRQETGASDRSSPNATRAAEGWKKLISQIELYLGDR
jgi:hypothetical protein